MAPRLARSLTVLALLIVIGCKKEAKVEPPIASTPLTKKTTPAGQPKAMPEPQVLPPVVMNPPVTPGLGLSREEEEFLNQVQQAREQAKLPRLKPNLVLFQLARDHAAKLAREGQLNSFVEPKGYPHLAFAANAGMSGKLDLPAMIASAGPNITDAKYQEVGMAVAQSPKGGAYYHVQVFGQPMSQK